MKARIEFIVHLVGLFLFGLVYENFKAFFGGGIWVLLVGLAYLLVFRLLGSAARRYVKRTGREWRSSNLKLRAASRFLQR